MALQTRQDINFQGIFKKLGAESFLFVTFANLYLQNLHMQVLDVDIYMYSNQIILWDDRRYYHVIPINCF